MLRDFAGIVLCSGGIGKKWVLPWLLAKERCVGEDLKQIRVQDVRKMSYSMRGSRKRAGNKVIEMREIGMLLVAAMMSYQQSEVSYWRQK